MKTFLYIKPQKYISTFGINAALFDLLGYSNHIQKFFLSTNFNIEISNKKILLNKIITNNVDIFYARFLNKEYIKSTDIKEWLSNIKLDIVQVNTAHSVIDTLFCDHFADYEIGYEDAQKICLELVIFLQNLQELKINFIYYSYLGKPQNSDLDKNLWLSQISKDLLINPHKDLVIDCLSLAILKVMAVNSYEAQCYSIKNIGLGSDNNNCIEILECEASIPYTIKEKSNIKSTEHYVYRCEAILDKSALLKKIYENLSDDVYKIYHTAIYDKNLEQKNMLVFFIDESKKEKVNKKILAYSDSIAYSPAELIRICQKTIALEVGLGNKKSICKFYEYIYGNEVIKTKIDHDDLHKYAYEWNENLEHTANILLSIYHQYNKSIK